MREYVRNQLWRLRRRNNQKGFTLIELLVVISILGILAAVVTMSMVGITRIAQDRAAATELQTVQVAYDTMLSDQQVPSDKTCDGDPGVGPGTNNMQNFPSGTVAQAGTPARDTVQLYPTYLRQQQTHGKYHCTGNGEIKQDSFTP